MTRTRSMRRSLTSTTSKPSCCSCSCWPGRQGAEVGEQHAGQGHVLVALAHQPFVFQHLLHVVDVGAAVDEPAFPIADDVRRFIFIGQLADDGLQQVVGGDQPWITPNSSATRMRLPFAWRSSASSLITLMVCGTMMGSFCLASSLRGLPFIEGKQQIARLDHPDHLVQIAVTDREQAVGLAATEHGSRRWSR